MYQINNFINNDDIRVLNELGPFTVIEYQHDLSVMPGDAALAYYCNAMNVRKRQVICQVGTSHITTQAGAMQWTVGDVNATGAEAWTSRWSARARPCWAPPPPARDW
ncbi:MULTISPECIES: hypothetical protein [unclassified Flavonifractor]|uniref:hypothetical protein n=1 Tax=Flavonifractor sp. An92 TaxID=1965666 RepID=UPI0026C078D4